MKDSLLSPPGPFILEWDSYYAEEGLPAPSPRSFHPGVGQILEWDSYYAEVGLPAPSPRYFPPGVEQLLC